MTQYADYKSFDAAYGFSAKAGFQLSPLQIADVEKFLLSDRNSNFYEVGGGKTVVSTVVALMRGKEQKLVTVPPILVSPWTNWLRQVSSNVLVFRGDPKERRQLNISSAHWVIATHSIFRIDFNRLERELSQSLEIIVDEAQALKNPQSVLFKKIQRLVS